MPRSGWLSLGVTYDEEADAAYLRFDQGETPTSLPLHHQGSLVAILDVAADGRILGLELLHASAQLSPEVLSSLPRTDHEST